MEGVRRRWGLWKRGAENALLFWWCADSERKPISFTFEIFKSVSIPFKNIFSASLLNSASQCLSRILTFCLSVNYQKAIGCQSAVPSYHLWSSWVSVLYLQKQMALVTLSPNGMALNLSLPCRSAALRNMPIDACVLVAIA